MKIYKLYYLIFALCFVTCNEEDNAIGDVQKYVNSLINGKYESMYLPNFTPEHIPILLTYADDFREIPGFITNPISSYHPPKFRLGECILWTIESIRLKYDSEEEMLKFPSMVPILIKEGFGNDPASGILNEDELNEVFGYYSDWWDVNSNTDFNLFRFDDILKDTNYTWR